jgi:DNA processing protein
MEYKLQTIVVARLNQIYPKPHKKYMAKMEENGGFMNLECLQSWQGELVRRNRIVAGMTEATIVLNQQIVVAL